MDQALPTRTTRLLGFGGAEFDVDRGFLLNGKHVRLNGVCLHHDGGSVGAAAPERVWERRLEILKAMGCNSIRTAHNPYAPEFLDLCDKLGFMVMNEVFDEWKQNKTANGYGQYFDEWSEKDITSFVRRDRNHPAVLLWSAGNEIGEQAAANGVEMVKRLVDIFHREDPTRPVTMGCDSIAANLTGREVGTPPEFLAVLDVVGYNYSDRRAKRAETYYSDDRRAFPQRRFIGTENGSMGGARGDYSELVPASSGAAPRRRGTRGTDFEQLWRFRRIYEYVSGDHMWTGIDHLGEASWPSKGSAAGVLDTCGFEKDGYYFCQSQWTDKPMVHVFPHWNWKGKEGDVIPVLCYTNCDTVELFVNGKSFGVQGYWFPRVGYWRPDGGADHGPAHHVGSAPDMDRAISTGHAQSRGRQGWEGCRHRGNRDHGRAGGNCALRRPGRHSGRPPGRRSLHGQDTRRAGQGRADGQQRGHLRDSRRGQDHRGGQRKSGE